MKAFIFTLLLIVISASFGNAAEDKGSQHGCELGQNPSKYEAACSWLLKRKDLSNEERAEALYLRGFGRMVTQRHAAAIVDFDKGLKLAPKHNRLHRQRAEIALANGNYSKAFLHAQKAIEFYPHGTEEHILMGRLYSKMGQDQLALDSFTKTIELKEDYAWARYFRAGILMKRKKYKDALKDTSRLVQIESSILRLRGEAEQFYKYVGLDVAVKARHAQILTELGRFKESEQVADSLVKNEGTALSFMARARVLMAMPVGLGFGSRSKEVTRDLKLAVKLDPQFTYAWQWLAHRLKSEGQFKESLEANAQAYNTNRIPGVFPDILWERAQIYQRAKKYKQAADFGIASMESALKLSPRFVAPYITRLRARGYWQKAELPTKMNEELVDVITACFMDPKCG